MALPPPMQDDLQRAGRGCIVLYMNATTNTKEHAMTITTDDLEAMEDHPEFGGWGYLVHENRTDATDAALLRAANIGEWTCEDVFVWANSRPARHLMDGAPTTANEYGASLSRWVRALKAEADA